MNEKIVVDSITIRDDWDNDRKCLVKVARVQFNDTNKNFFVTITLKDKDVAELINLCAKYISRALTHRCDDVLKSFKQFVDKISEQENKNDK